MLKILFTAGLALTALSLSPFRVDPVFSIKEDFFILVSTLIIVTGLWYIYFNGLKLTIPIILLGAFAMLAVTSILWASNRYEGFKEAYRWLLFFGVALIAFQIRYTGYIKNFIFAGMITGAITALLGIFEYYGLRLLFAEEGKIISLFGHQNLLGQYLSIAFVWSVCMVLFYEKLRWLSFVCALITLYGLLITVCRSAWLGSVAGLGCVFILYALNRRIALIARKFLLFCLIVFIALGVFISLEKFLPAGSDITAVGSRVADGSLKTVRDVVISDNILSDRQIIWKSTLKLISRRLFFGHGIGNYWIMYPSTDPEFVDFSKYAHNDYLQILSETGVAGFSLFGLFLIISLWKILRYLPRANFRHVYYPLTAGVVAVCVDAVFSYGFFMPVPSYVFAVSIGALLAMLPVQGLSAKTFKSAKIIATGLSCWFILVAGCYLYARNAGYYYYYKASLEIARDYEAKDLSRAKKYIGKAVSYLPYEPELKFFEIMFELQEGNFSSARNIGYVLLGLTPYEKKIILFMAKLEAVMGNKGSSEKLYARMAASDTPLNSVYVQNMLEHYDSFYEQIHSSALTVEAHEAIISELNNTLEKQPDNEFARFIRGSLLLKSGNWSAANDDLTFCIETCEKYPLAYLLRGMCNARTGDLKQAYRDYERYAVFDPKSEAAILGIAIVSQKMGLFEQAQHHLQHVLRLNPKNAKALRNMGILQLEKGNELLAADYFERSLQIDPRQTNADDIRAVIESIR